jgi:tungstate transport system substrate-binding protein
MISRRRLLAVSPAALVVAPWVAVAQQRPSLADPLRVGVDHALNDSGLARALQRGFGVDTGIAVKLVPGAALPLLDGLERGEFDATLTNAPAAEGKLDEQGLAHDRHAIARGEFLIVGPRPRPKEKDVAAIAGLTQAAEALIQIRNAALAMPGTITFLSAGDGSGAHVLEQALWRQAKLGPTPPWYLQAERGSGLIAQARARGAYAVVERGAWVAEGGGPLAMLVERDPALAESVQVLRAFRVNHPAGKIFVAWITGPKGQRVVAAQRAYRVA